MEAGVNGVGGDKPLGVLEVQSWVCCSRCEKWRRVAQSVADALDEDTPWYCEMNTCSIYNDCDVPQELTDQQIDQLQDQPQAAAAGGAGAAGAGGGGEAKGGDASLGGRLRKKPPVWQIIKHNIYTHRARKEQDEDDIMICQCKKLWPSDPTTSGCGPNCLNRMLNIECVTEFCPSGDRCSNQMFTRKEYASLDVKRAGAKGFGLFAKEALKAGDFVIEYIGEVLEEEEYHRRKEFYIQTQQRHVYFMNIGNGEVIDACRKGHVGRFINHSCDPNCETQKWLVHGELAIGLFALRDIEAGEELTFDYNFERYGDKPLKCLCGSKNCRGIIGGTQEGAQNTREAIVPADAENEPEPIMVTEEDEDKALAAILDRCVGLGWERGWNSSMQRRLQSLAASHGIDLEALSEDEEEDEEEGGSEGEGASADEEISEASGEGSEAGEVSGGGAPTTSSGRKAGPTSTDKRAAAAAAPARKPSSAVARRRQQQRAEDAAAAAELAAKLSVASGSKKHRILAASQAAKAAAAASQQLPLRKRLKKLARAARKAGFGGEAEGGEAQQQQGSAAGTPAQPATSTASQQRLSKQAHSVASTSTALGGGASAATPVPLIPKRLSSQQAAAAALSAERIGAKQRRRSEIDRRLDELVGPSGRLRDTSAAAIVRFLRLFNLCDIGPTISKSEEAALREQYREEQQQRERDRERERERGPAAAQAPLPPQQLRPASPAAPPQAEGAAKQQQPAAAEVRPPSRADDGGGAEQSAAAAAAEQRGSPGAGELREEGEVSPERSGGPASTATEAGEGLVPPPPPPGGPPQPPPQESPAEQQPSGAPREDGVGAAAAAQQQQQQADQQQQHLPPQQAQQQQQQKQPSGSPTRHRDRWEDEGVSRLRAAREELQQRGELSPRQRARLADMSMLLDVIIKTNSQNARREFVKCGILRQLLATIGHNVGPQYGIILRKVFRAVESLPFSADDMHHTRSAHGSFADLLRLKLTQHTDYEVRNKAWALLRQYPVKDCSRPPMPEVPSGCGGGLHSGVSSRSRVGAGWSDRPLWERERRDSDVRERRESDVRERERRDSEAQERDGGWERREPHPFPESPGFASPAYPGRSPPHRELPPSRLGGMQRDWGTRRGEPFFDRPPYGPGPGPPPGVRLPFPPHHPGGPFPGGPPPPMRGSYPGGPPPPPPGRHFDGPPGRDHRGGPPGKPWPPVGEPPLPSAANGRAAAESIAAALVNTGPSGAPPGSAPPATAPATIRRKRSRWEQDGEQPEQRPNSAGSTGEGAAAAAGGPSLLPPGFGGGGAAQSHSPPPRPPSVLATAQPGEGEEPPSKRAAAAGAQQEASAFAAAAGGMSMEELLAEGRGYGYAGGSLAHAYSGGRESSPRRAGGEGMDLSPVRGAAGLPSTAAAGRPPQPVGHFMGRPASGNLSDLSRGDSGSSGPGGRGPAGPRPGTAGLPPHMAAQQQQAAAVAATGSPGGLNGGLHLSPMTDPSPSSPSLPNSAGGGAGGGPGGQASAESWLTGEAAFFRVAPTVQDEEWDEPSTRFERFVDEVVRSRIGKYVQPGHPAQLDLGEAMQLYKKVAGQVVAKEHEAFADRQRTGLHKPIVRAKLEAKVREFVRDSVRRILQQRGQPF